MQLSAISRQVDGVTIVDLSGRIVVGEESSMLGEKLTTMAEQGHRKVLLNLADVSYVDSSGLGALVRGTRILASQQGQLKLLNLGKRIHDLMSLTKLLSIFEIHNDETAAINSFR